MHPTILEILNNRELALLLWLTIAFLLTLLSVKMRSVYVRVVACFFVRDILIIFSLLLLYFILCIYTLQQIGFWEWHLAKDTVFWFIGSASVFLFRSVNIKETSVFRQAVLDSIKWTAVYEFIVNLSVFSFAGEMVLLPFLTFLLLMQQHTKEKAEYRDVNTVLNYTVGIAGINILSYTFYKLITNYNNYTTTENLQSFLLSPLLVVLLIPFLYGTALYSRYQNLFLLINFKIKDNDLARATKMKALRIANVDLTKVNLISAKLYTIEILSASEIESKLRLILTKTEVIKSEIGSKS